MSSDNHDPRVSPNDPTAPLTVASIQSQRRHWPKWIGPPNPFYLLSAACVIHSTGLSISGAVKDLPPLTTSALIAGYLFLLASVGVVVVKLWRVWDDARSILLTLLLLMLEWTLAFDKLLIDSPRFWGVIVLILAGTCIGLSEAIIRLLRLNLPAIYRVPFYLQLGLMLAAGAIPANLMHVLSEEQLRWLIVLITLLWSAMILTLLPAVRAGAGAVQMRHVPWVWPYYPWSLFVVLWTCLGFRVWTLSLSFDAVTSLSLEAAMQMQNSFLGPFIFVPPLMAMAVLALEAAIVRGAVVSRVFAGTLPAVGVVLAAWTPQANPAAAEFLTQLTSSVGAPVWTAVWLALIVSVLGALRGLPECRRMAALYLAVLAVVDARTISFPAGFPAHVWPLWIVAGGYAAAAIVKRRSTIVLEALLWGIAGLLASDWQSGLPFSRAELVGHVCVAGVIAAGLVGKDDFAELLRSAGAFLSLLALPVGLDMSVSPERPWWGPMAYLAMAAVSLGLIGLATRWKQFLRAGIALLVGSYLVGYIEAGQYLHAVARWRGATTFLWGLVLLHAAVGVSAIKGRMNSAGPGSPHDRTGR